MKVCTRAPQNLSTPLICSVDYATDLQEKFNRPVSWRKFNTQHNQRHYNRRTREINLHDGDSDLLYCYYISAEGIISQ